VHGARDLSIDRPDVFEVGDDGIVAIQGNERPENDRDRMHRP